MGFSECFGRYLLSSTLSMTELEDLQGESRRRKEKSGKKGRGRLEENLKKILNL